MIQPNELRKGNMVIHVDSGIARLVTVGYIDAWLDIIFHQEYYTDQRHKILYEKMEAIPLTEAVLMAAGYVYFEGKYDWGYTNGNGIPVCDFNGEYFYLDALDQQGITLEIKTLHQLQNLIFALTGKELEINMEELKKAVG